MARAMAMSNNGYGEKLLIWPFISPQLITLPHAQLRPPQNKKRYLISMFKTKTKIIWHHLDFNFRKVLFENPFILKQPRTFLPVWSSCEHQVYQKGLKQIQILLNPSLYEISLIVLKSSCPSLTLVISCLFQYITITQSSKSQCLCSSLEWHNKKWSILWKNHSEDQSMENDLK